MRVPALSKLTLLLASALVLVAGIGSIPGKASADSVAVIPPRFDMFGNPGDTIVEKLRVRNDSDTAIAYSIVVDDFKAKDDVGGVNLFEQGEQAANANFQLAKWVTVEPTQFTIGASQEAVLNITVKIPKDAEPGGHFASVLVQRAGTQTAGGAAVESRVGSLILLRVSGAVTESASVDSFKAEESYTQYGPITFDLRTKNDGNVHVAPTGTIVITHMFGHKVAEIPLTTANVLPDSARIVKTLWDEKYPIGRYTATLVASYGQITDANGHLKTLSATTSFIVFPLYLVWITIGIIVLLYLLISQRKNLKKLLNRLTAD